MASDQSENLTIHRRAGNPDPADFLSLTTQQEQIIHQAASALVAAAVLQQPVPLTDATLGGAAEQQVMGAFVSLKRRGHLRGCCGVFGIPTPLVEALTLAATRTATEDFRLPPISPPELPYLDLEVWLLYAPQPVTARGIQRAAAVCIGRHGVYLRRGRVSGLLLPSVAVEHQLDAKAFLAQVCHKAHLPPTAWQEDSTYLVTFEGHAITGRFDPSLAAEVMTRVTPLLSTADAIHLAAACRRRIMARLQGTVAGGGFSGEVDGPVQGVSIAAHFPGSESVRRFSSLSLRPSLPLQATLSSLEDQVVQALGAYGIERRRLTGLHIGLTVLWNAATHGTIEAGDLAGVDSSRCAIMVLEGERWAWVYDPQQSPPMLLTIAAREAQVRHPAVATVVSFTTVSTDAPVIVTSHPSPPFK